MYSNVKRILDVALSFALIQIFLPLILFGLIGSAIAHKANPLFIQKRTGKNGVPFNFYKIRSMRDEVDGQDNSDGARLTRFGAFIRRTSIDELPQLFNILRGDMSLIGPRPQKHEYYSLMTVEDKRRYSIRPGLSGWSQVNGRNLVTWQERFKQDNWYVDNMSARVDLLIAWKTLVVTILGHGVSAPDCATMPGLDEEIDAREDFTSTLPLIISDIIRNNQGAYVSFSLHDLNYEDDPVRNPCEIFMQHTNQSERSLYFSDIYLDVWRRPLTGYTAFPIGTVGPFNVTVEGKSVTFNDNNKTKLLLNMQRKHAVRSLSA